MPLVAPRWTRRVDEQDIIAMDDLSHLLAPSQVARLAGLSYHQVWRAIRVGALPAMQTPLGSVVRAADAEAFIAQRAARVRAAGPCGESDRE